MVTSRPPGGCSLVGFGALAETRLRRRCLLASRSEDCLSPERASPAAQPKGSDGVVEFATPPQWFWLLLAGKSSSWRPEGATEKTEFGAMTVGGYESIAQIAAIADSDISPNANQPIAVVSGRLVHGPICLRSLDIRTIKYKTTGATNALPSAA
jgi:hypothetical protein